jgi:hypothetical protein
MPSSPALLSCALGALLAIGGCATTRTPSRPADGALLAPAVERVGPGGDFEVSVAGAPAFSTAGYGNPQDCQEGWAAFVVAQRERADLGGLTAAGWNPCTSRALPAVSGPSAEPRPAAEPDVIAGGWMDQDPDDASLAPVVAAAVTHLQAATEDPSLALVVVRRAQTQVVAGTRYRFDLQLTSDAGPRGFDDVVFQPLGEQPLELSSWSEGAVAGAQGVLLGLQAGDVACYIDVQTEAGTFTHYGAFEVCEEESSLIGQAVSLTFETGRVIAPSCQGDPDCPDSIEVQLVTSIAPR